MTGENWLQKFKDLSEGKKSEQPKTEEARKESLDGGKAHNDELHKEQVLHRRAAFDSDVPRNHKVSGVLGRPEIVEKDVYGRLITHVKGIGAPAPGEAKDSNKTSGIDKHSLPGHGLEKNAERQVSSDSTKRNLQIENATHSMLETASQRFGSADIESLHIAKDDVGSAISALVLGPAVCKQMGPEQMRVFGKRLIVFGVAPVLGMAEETKRQFSEHTKETVHEGSGNILAGTVVGALLEHINPVVLTIATISGAGLFLKDQLASPEHQSRNNELIDISHKIDGASSSQLFELSDRTRKLVGSDLYKAAFTLATGGIGIPEGQALKAAAQEEAHGLIRIHPEDVLNSLKNLGDETWDMLGYLVGERPQLVPAMVGVPGHPSGGILRMQEFPGARKVEDGILKMQGASSGKELPLQNVKRILDEVIHKPVADKLESITELNRELLRESKSPIHTREQADVTAAIEGKVQKELGQLQNEVATLKPQADAIESKPEEQWTKSDEALLEKYRAGEDALDTVITDRLKARYGWDGRTPGGDDLSISLKSGIGSQREVSHSISSLLNGGLDKNPEVLQVLKANGLSKERARDWIGLPMPGSSAADHGGCDYLLVNRTTGEMYPIDITENCSFVRRGRVVDSKLMNSSLVSEKPADRQQLVIAIPKEFEIDNAYNAERAKLSSRENGPKFEEAVRNRQVGEIIGHMISQPSRLNILDAQLPASEPGLPLSRQAYELWRFGTDLQRLGYPKWADSLKKAIGYLKSQDRNIPNYF